MDQILENSYFRNNNKNKYSFSKGERFPHIKTINTIDFYETSSVQKTRSTTFGYGSKFDFLKAAKKGPSPFQYSIDGASKTKRGTSFGPSREVIKANSYIDPQKIKIPTAGEYIVQYEKILRKSPGYKMGGMRSASGSYIKPSFSPPSTKYNPIDSFSRHPSKSKFGFGSSPRFDYLQKEYNNTEVGPGSYSNLPHGKTKYGKIGNAVRKTYAVEETEKSCSPGPKYILQ